MTIIITCGETRASLSAVRALGRAGIPVAVSSYKKPSLSMWSRFASSSFLTNDPKVSAQVFTQQIADELKARYASCFLVGSDDAFWAISRFRDLLPLSAQKILPPHYSVVRSLDHEALHNFAESLGVPCAPFIRIPGDSDLEMIMSLLEGSVWPKLFRPIIPWTEREDGTRRVNKRFVAKSARHLRILFNRHPELFKNGALVSAYRTKRAISYFGVCDRAKVVVEGFQERLSEQEPYNEVATLALTIDPIIVIRKHTQNLLEALQWQGPFKAEFIKDERGNYRLISLIGRLWGSLQLSISAGVNIPLICYALAQETLDLNQLRNARPHVAMRWLIGDAASKFFNAGHVVKNIFALSHNLAAWDKIKHLLGKQKTTTCYDVFDLQDPMPFLFELQHKTWRRAFGENA
ncbi:MAG: hypothetical protein KC505_07100 [Myxococcales bacterium]|nr:hypothetical protein [Myxococcales bacterium]USN50624.1 MAG: hypothetical protein H6731_10235 [Myxococcales bacterium]